MTRDFHPLEHIVNLDTAALTEMYDDLGTRLVGINGVGGSRGFTADGTALGVDRIVMQPGTAFPLHVHEGDHLLVILAGNGSICVDGVNHALARGDSIYVPAELPHGVGGPVDEHPFEILAFGIPHHLIDSRTRMRLVREDNRETGTAAG